MLPSGNKRLTGDNVRAIGECGVEFPMSCTPSAKLETVANDAQGASRLESFAGGVAIMLALTVVQRGVGFLRAVLFCRWLDADQLGQWDLCFNWLMLLAPLAVLGLPGSFGRYVDHFRQRGQLRAFLARVSVLSAGLAIVAVGLIAWHREAVTAWIFGSAGNANLTVLVVASLGAVIAFNFLISLFTALRQYRAISRIQLAQTLLFAALGIALLRYWQPRAESVVIAFGVSSMVTAAGAMWALRAIWRELPRTREPLSYGNLTAKLAPFAFWLWVTNWASNAFEMVDRWMIVHYGGLDSATALEAVGQYHSARVMPLLLIGIADLLANMLTPHLSSDWEAGRRTRVSERLNFVLKLAGIGLSIAAVGVLWISPALFHLALQYKFAGGEAIVSWALTCAVWTGLALIGFNYLWCAEKSRWVSLTLAAGLIVSVSLNLALLPHFGLLGAAWSATAARLVSLVVLAVLLRHYGMALDARLLPLAAAPALLPLGGLATLAALILAVRGIGPWRGCFTAEEWRQIRLRLAGASLWLSALRMRKHAKMSQA